MRVRMGDVGGGFGQKAYLARDEQTREVIRFVDYWKDLTGRNPQWLYFDSKLTTYEELSELNSRNIYFVTIRRRGSAILKRLEQTAGSDWKSAMIDIPKRRNQRIRYLDESIQLDDYDGALTKYDEKGVSTANRKATHPVSGKAHFE